MYRSMYDLLNKSKISYKDEYYKLWKMVHTKPLYSYNSKSYTFRSIFDKFIALWKYKGIKCSTDEVLEELNIVENPKVKAEDAIIRLCDFIINIREFLSFEKNRIDNEVEEIVMQNSLSILGDETRVPPKLYMKDKILIDLVNELINSLNYEVLKKEDYQCFIIKKNSDAEETAKVVEDEDISSKILQYNDYTIIDNIEAKKSILKSLADYFEGKRNSIKEINSNLENNISFALNNFHIRHNNKVGKKSNEFIKNISDKNLIEIYDELYFLMLIAFRLIELNNFERNIEDIRKNDFNK